MHAYIQAYREGCLSYVSDFGEKHSGPLYIMPLPLNCRSKTLSSPLPVDCITWASSLKNVIIDYDNKFCSAKLEKKISADVVALSVYDANAACGMDIQHCESHYILHADATAHATASAKCSGASCSFIGTAQASAGIGAEMHGGGEVQISDLTSITYKGSAKVFVGAHAMANASGHAQCGGIDECTTEVHAAVYAQAGYDFQAQGSSSIGGVGTLDVSVDEHAGPEVGATADFKCGSEGTDAAHTKIGCSYSASAYADLYSATYSAGFNGACGGATASDTIRAGGGGGDVGGGFQGWSACGGGVNFKLGAEAGIGEGVGISANLDWCCAGKKFIQFVNKGFQQAKKGIVASGKAIARGARAVAEEAKKDGEKAGKWLKDAAERVGNGVIAVGNGVGDVAKKTGNAFLGAAEATGNAFVGGCKGAYKAVFRGW